MNIGLEVTIIFILNIFKSSEKFFKKKIDLVYLKNCFKNLYQNLIKIEKNILFFMWDNLSLFGFHV